MSDAILNMTEQEFLELDAEDATRLISARFHALCARGCEPEAAAVVAVRPEIGVADASDLIRRGCDARTALRILR